MIAIPYKLTFGSADDLDKGLASGGIGPILLVRVRDELVDGEGKEALDSAEDGPQLLNSHIRPVKQSKVNVLKKKNWHGEW